MSSLRLWNVLFLGSVGIVALLACGDGPVTAGGGGGSDKDGGAEAGGGDDFYPAEFGLDERPSNATCKAPARPPSTAPVGFERAFQTVAFGGAPMMLAQRPNDGSRWYVALRNGTISYFPAQGATGAPTPAGSLTTLATAFPVVAGKRVNETGEGGFLGFAFHPKFGENGRLYVTWTSYSGRSVIGYVTSTDGGNTFTSYETILSFDQTTSTNHKGGGLAFGKDGYLYASFGDGGGSDDQWENGQKTTGFFAKVLRIDVDNVPPDAKYGIPDGNPFKNGGGEPATFAYGLRNPFRFSIDRESGEVWAGDVGQNRWEEIDLIKAGGNYGWPCREGTHDYSMNPARCPSPRPQGIIDPVTEIEHTPTTNTRSITGGVVYRGKKIPGLAGTYIFGDYKKQETFTLTTNPVTGASTTTKIEDAPAVPWVHFAEDVDGEIYGVGFNGVVQRVVQKPGAPDAAPFPDRLSKTGCVDASDPKKPASGLVPFGVNAALWSDGAEKERFIALPDGKTITVGADGDFEFPPGTVLVKTFSIAGKRIETRLFVRHDDGAWAGYTYEWLDDESDAVYLPSSKIKRVADQPWYYPSRSDCVRCHTEAAGRSLGLEIGQLNTDFAYPSTNRISNQLATLEKIGMFSAPLGSPPDSLPKLALPYGPDGAEDRARAYLHANCSGCHRPNGGGRGPLDLRYTTSFKDTKACNGATEAGDLGVADAKLLVPGAPEKSVMSLRIHAKGSNRMPPLASSVVDEKGTALVDEWIRSVAACPP
jgi:uncharacterized repeat protein (TIGR03806 family)